MARYKFSSVFADDMMRYIKDKNTAGYNGENFRSRLIGFDKFCIEYNLTEPVFTVHHASKWLEKKECESHPTHYGRINAIKHFLIYLSIKGYDVYITRDVKFKGTDFQPHIYTNEECDRYFMAVDNYSNCRNRKDAIQYPVLFRILYCCGTRINETLGIRRKDVDLDKGILQLNETKNDRQRYVIVGDDLKELLNCYAEKCFYMLNDDDYIFTNANRGRLDEKTIYDNHREFLFKARIPYLGDGKGPRIHDWRHHMAVYAFKQMIDSGFDMYVALPILSTYLGHKTIYATEKYIRLTLQLFPYIEEKFHGMVDRIFGGTAYENN
ncbi:site-specific recombinase XerD [Anaerobacterium chartisolvens]|uniref:Site-specific recombinase XerD n=1 Tax=Anaerobacterium chartisolvens TaxID=1297424 RepID=A0A369ASZ8_9FIRM|nr:tyrosine-type recombinase/integrase [Anaerobacterium chartisolvens]RCX12113.1 site-specific recombinase XerD [Anaerobacterium chartisolvens]